jgi:hypothetical protein
MNWHTITNVVWFVLAGAAVALAWVARATRGVVVTVDALARAAVARTGPRYVVLLLWMWLGWHAFAR